MSSPSPAAPFPREGGPPVSWKLLLAPSVGWLVIGLFYLGFLWAPGVSSVLLHQRALQLTFLACLSLWGVAFASYLAMAGAAANAPQSLDAQPRHLELLMNAVSGAAQGDLTVSLEDADSEEPLVKGFENMLVSLRDLVRNMQQLGVAVKGAS